MSNTRKIELEIYEDKLTDFYLSLLNWKTSDKKDLELLRHIVEAIHIDREILEKGIEISPAQKQRIQEQLQSIYEHLLKSKKDSEDYYKVSKESSEAFTNSAFGKELYAFLYSLETRKLLSGKEKSVELNLAVASLTKFLTSLMNSLASAIGLPLKDKPGLYRLRTDKNGYMMYEFGEGVYKMETGAFLQTSKGIIHLNPAKDLLLLSDEHISTLFLTIGGDAIRLDEKDDEIELCIYEHVKTQNGRLYISSAKIGQTFSVPKELFKYGDLSETELFKSIESEFSHILKLPANISEQIISRDRDIMIIYNLLKKHYSFITQHTACTIIGYIASSIGLLDSEVIYHVSNRTQPYRKYLRDTVYNILKKHEAVGN